MNSGMDIHNAVRSDAFRAGKALLLAVVIGAILPGCITSRGLFSRNRDHMAGAPRLRNSKNPGIEEVVAHLNQNTDRIQNWRTNNVRIRCENMSLSGNIAVEKGHRLRLFVNSPLGKELDLGSNDERFWVWSRRMDPAFVTCKHENLELVRQGNGIPFEPDWLMQALGVEPLPTTGVTMESDREKEQARLVEQVISADGRPLRRVVLVDLKRGIVLEHSLYAHNAGRIAFARLGDHRLDKSTGLVLPHRVMLEWPENRMTMQLTLGEIRVNSSSIPDNLWEMPSPQDCQIVHLDSGARRDNVMTAVRPDFPVRMGPIETINSHDDHNFLRDGSDPRPTGDPAGHSSLSDEFDDDDDVEPAGQSKVEWEE